MQCINNDPFEGEHLYLRGRSLLENGSQQKYIADSQAVSLTALAPCMRQITTPSTSQVIVTWGLIIHYLINIVDSETRLFENIMYYSCDAKNVRFHGLEYS